MICCSLQSKLMSFCVKTICNVGCCGMNDCTLKYSYDGICHPCGMTWNGFYRNHSDFGCGISEDGIVTLICCNCICPGDSGKKLICCGVWYEKLVSDGMQVYLRMVASVDNPSLYVHIHHAQSSIYSGNDMLCDLITGIENTDPPHGTGHSLLMMVSKLLSVAVGLGVSQLHL